jgi:hypothetical protein
MRTEFYVHESAREELAAWLADLASRAPNGAMIAQIALESIRTILLRNQGILSKAIPDVEFTPTRYWWEFSPGDWVSYVVLDSGFWRWKRRRIIVFSVGETPPARVVPSFPRG